MQTEMIIKLIGHRPVYRVERQAVSTPFQSGGQAAASRGAPIIEQEARNRFISGAEEREPYERLS